VPVRRPDKPAVTATSAAAENLTHVKTTVTTDVTGARTTQAVNVGKPKQEEFGFQGEPAENRGTFDKSDRNLFEGQDLDVPTYLRKGIKVAI
jgi:cell division protein FtsZ